MNIHEVCENLVSVGIPVTGVFEETEFTDPCIGISDDLMIQIAGYGDIPFILLSFHEGYISPVSSFANVNELIHFLMEY